ncbi:phage tail tape measure protein, TP901 family, core region [Lacrimispora sphenoides]|uniref:phage tail tape measure protein n=1 Tax=Lacrimispora sphenoides TaxID=29370 RepID=UPI0008BC1849|nr:phage tail tape measure protein [Lacrimispora sphenoides]SEU08212.1 phage tail tape measure protein, TP901 family, core region [Lacrimispora sphenoides]
MADNISLILQTMIDSSKLKNEQLPKLIAQVKEQYKLKFDVELDDKTAKKYANQIFKARDGLKEIDKITFTNQIQAWRRVNSAAEKEFGGTLDELLIKLKEIDNKSDFGNLQKRFRGVKAEADALGVTGKSIGDTFAAAGQKFGEWALVTGSIATVVQLLRQMPKNVIEINTAMTNLYKVTDETESKYRSFLTNANKDAQTLGRSVSSLVEQTANWAKLGYSIDQSANLAKISSIYSNVGEVDDDTAVSDMVTALKGFNLQTSDSIKLIDIYNKLGNEFAVTSKGIGEGVKNSASALALQGNTLEQTVAMLTGGGEITQEVGELGNMLKVASLRLASMKGKLEEIGEAYEDINSVSKNQTQIYNLTKGQVNILDEQNGKLKSTYQILEEVSKAWKDVNDLDKSTLLELMFGKQRANQGAAILTAFQSGQIQKALSAAMNADGSAQQEQDRWAESLDAKLQQLNASFQTLSNTVVNSNFLKVLIESGTTLNNVFTELIRNFGILPTLVSGAGIASFVKNFA